jgi:DNA polymerase III subunit epsilon
MNTFAAIDFETASYSADSACAVGVVIVKGARIVRRENHLIRPPTRDFVFTHIHGLTWQDVRSAPTFAEVWAGLRELLQDVTFLAAHNARFDRNVLSACCRSHRLRKPALPFVYTVEVARKVWGVFPTKLPDVCRRLNIPLRHHDALSDAEACARIILAALRAGWGP